MKRLALPLERIWKTMEDKIECPTELDWLDLNERAQITAYTSRTPRQTPAAFNKQKQVGLHVSARVGSRPTALIDVRTPKPPQLRRTRVVAGREASWYPLASGK